MKVSFEYIPEHYVGKCPYAVIRIKESQLTAGLRSRIENSLSDETMEDKELILSMMKDYVKLDKNKFKNKYWIEMQRGER